MPLGNEIKESVYEYCYRDLPTPNWYENELDFIEDVKLRKRLIEEFMGIRFAYKLYEGLEAKDENLIFEVRHQIFAYATIYEAIIHYVLYTYYADTSEFHELQYNKTFARIDIPTDKISTLQKCLSHNNERIYTFIKKERKKDDSQVRFDDKCKTAEELGLIHKIENKKGEEVDIVSEIIEIYSYRNAIHLAAEQRKGIKYELELSKLAYRRMQPFIKSIKDKLKSDKKSVFRD